MAYCNDAFFGAFAAVRTKRICSYVDVRAISVLMGEPGEVMRRKRSLQLNDSLNCRGGNFTPQKQSNGLPRSETTGEEFSSSGGCILSIRLWHVSPRRSARSGSAWRPGRIHEPPALPGGCGGRAAAQHERQNQALPDRADLRGETCHSLMLRMQPPLLLNSSPVVSLRGRPLLCFYGVKFPPRQFRESFNWRLRLRLITSPGSPMRTLMARTST